MDATAGLPFLLVEGDEVAFVPPQTDLPRRARVLEVRPVDEHRAEVVFEGVESPEGQGLVGCHCLIRRADIDEGVFEDASALWEGWRVVDDELGDIGTVSDIVENPAHPLLEVEREDAESVLVPVVDEIVYDVDVEGRVVRTRLPEGLLDL